MLNFKIKLSNLLNAVSNFDWKLRLDPYEVNFDIVLVSWAYSLVMLLNIVNVKNK